jgi:hypothetical protein
MRRAFVLACLTLLLTASGADARGLRAPALASPANGARVQQLPAITWGSVKGAAGYEYQISADAHFNSIALGRGPGRGINKTHDLAAALDKTVPNGTYYWRVRALTSKDRPGAWSRVRRIVKSWDVAPSITAGNGAAVSWPATPLVLRWSSVPYANKYIVSIATDPALSNLVLGSSSRPVETQGVNFALPISLAPGPYYWAITPVDAEGRHGARSALGFFTWTWPTKTTTSVTDLNPGAGVFDDPMYSWVPIPGAARYEVEVNSSKNFAPGSKWCCSGTTIGTSLAPLPNLANNTYYWRVRAIDARGDAGVWNEGQPFEKTFDPATVDPFTHTLRTVHNLTVRNANGEALSGTPATDTPIVTWDPVPGASLYEVQLGQYESGLGCDWSQSAKADVLHAFTATTAWTPLGHNVAGRQGPPEWPVPQKAVQATPAGGAEYCVRVLARADDDGQANEVISAWTQINGANQPAFRFLDPPPAGSPGKGGLVMENGYLEPTARGALNGAAPAPCQAHTRGGACTMTPLFTWERVPGAEGYFVVISRDPRFTEVADVGFTNVPAYAPRLANESPLADETTEYYWAVMPSSSATGFGVFSTPCYPTSTNPCGEANDNPQAFNKSSDPPQPLAPATGAEVATQPTFRWSSVLNARTYQLQVAQDPTFGKPIDDVRTDATAYTSTATYPADTALYWRVRGTDWRGQGLNWSPAQPFIRRLPVPTASPLEPVTLLGIPPLTWSAVPGAIGYEMHVEQPSGKSDNFSFEAATATISKYYGTGVFHYQVRAKFPTSTGGTVGGAYTSMQTGVLMLAAPRGAHGTRSGSRLLVTWHPEPDAKQYEVEISTTSGFASRVETHRVDGASWAPNIDLHKKRYRGALYWRVAPIDQQGGIGSFTAGAFTGKHARSQPRCGAKSKHKTRCRRH